MTMRRRCGASDHAVSRLAFAAQRLVPVDARPARTNERRYLRRWPSRWDPQLGIVHTVKVST